MNRRNHAKKAQQHSAVAMSLFFNVIAGLNEANRHLELVQVQSREARDFHRAEVQRHAEEARQAIDAHEHNLRVLERIAALTD